MTVTDSVRSTRSAQPIDVLAERLNDPGVAASLVTLLDNAELLSTLVLGLSGFISRSEMIVDSLAEGLNDIRTVSASRPAGLPSLEDLKTISAELLEAAPILRQVLASSMTSPATIELLSTISESAVEGAERARANQTQVKGAFGALKAMKEPEVQRGLGMLIEIARALGRRL